MRQSIAILLTGGAHVQGVYGNRFVCLCVTKLAPTYLVCMFKVRQHGVRIPCKVLHILIVPRGLVSRVTRGVW